MDDDMNVGQILDQHLRDARRIFQESQKALSKANSTIELVVYGLDHPAEIHMSPQDSFAFARRRGQTEGEMRLAIKAANDMLTALSTLMDIADTLLVKVQIPEEIEAERAASREKFEKALFQVMDPKGSA